MHELTAGAFDCLFGPRCEDCGGPEERCAEPYALSTKGQASSRLDDPDNVITWPRCPRTYQAVRPAGQDWLSLHRIVEWAHERRAHLSRDLSAGGARLMREWLRIREIPGQLLEARHIEEAKGKA